MQPYTHYLLSLLVAFFLPRASAQNEANKWIFGAGVGIDFSVNPPANISSSTFSNNASLASIADASGNLAFYTDGKYIYTATHTLMANGSGLAGEHNGLWSSPVIICPRPGSSTQYYVFTTCMFGYNNFATGLYYSVVDMSLASGQGSVTVKNTLLYSGSIAGRITGTRHCNGTDLWIVIRTASNANTSTWSGLYDFLSYHLSATGVNTLAATTSFSYAYTSEYAFSSRVGQMKISPNGKKLACAHAVSNSTYNINVGSAEIYDFDTSTGLLTNRSILYKQPCPGNGWSNAWMPAIEFSPDCSKLYGGLSNNFFYPNGAIIQWDLCSGNNYSVDATQLAIQTPTNYSINGFVNFQLAPDGKIYANHYGMSADSLSVINFPNLGGAACGFSYAMQPNTPGQQWWFMPNFMSDIFFMRGSIPSFSMAFAPNTSGCKTLQFQSPLLPGTPIGNCPANTYTLQNLKWDFGDPSSSSNTSTSSNPIHIFSTSGIYIIKLLLDFGCGAGKTILTQSLIVTNPAGGSVNYSPNLACYGINSGTASYVNAQIPNLSYQWTNGSGTYTSSSVNGMGAGTWSFVVTNTLSGCKTESVFTIQQPPPLQASLNQTLVCQGNSLTVTAGGGTPLYDYSWQGGTSYSTSVAGVAGTNTVMVIDANGCSKVLSFTVNPLPLLICRDTSICSGTSASLVPTGAASYTWASANVFSHTFVVKPSTTTIYTLSGANQFGCVSSKKIYVYVNSLPDLKISSSHTQLCTGSTATLLASGANNYTWFPGLETSSDLIVSPLNSITYSLTGTDNLGCRSSQIFNLPVVVSPALKVLRSLGDTVCAGAIVNFTATGADTYVWQPGGSVSHSMSTSNYSNFNYTLSGISNGCMSVLTLPVYSIPCKKPAFGLANNCYMPDLVSSRFYKVDFTILAANTTSLSMTDVWLNDNLYETFFNPCTYTLAGVPTVKPSSSQLKMNAAFDGRSDLRLTLPELSVLPPRTTDTICFSLLLEPRHFYGITWNTATGSVFLSNGLLARDSSHAGMQWDPDGDGDPGNNNTPTKIEIGLIDLFIPEGFSPDGDGKNDLFFITGLRGREIKFTVFNRWGNEVFKTQGADISWDGQPNVKGLYFGNGKLPSATYFYVVEFLDGSLAPVKGFVVLHY